MEKSGVCPTDKGLVLNFPGPDGWLYFHLDEGHFYSRNKKCADSQFLELLESTEMVSECHVKPGVPHNHQVPSRSVVEISAVLWACKLKAISSCNTEETITEIVANVVAAWPHKLPISVFEIKSKFSWSLEKYQHMAKGGNNCTPMFFAKNGEEVFSRFREAILQPRSYWNDPIITADPKNPICPKSCSLLSVNSIEGEKEKKVLKKLEQIIEMTTAVSEKTYSRCLQQFKDVVFEYRNLLMKISSQCDAERIYEKADQHLILNPARLNSWLQCKLSEMEVKRVIQETHYVRLVDGNHVSRKLLEMQSRQEAVLLLHVPPLDTWTKKASEEIKREVKNFALKGRLDSNKKSKMTDDRKQDEESNAVWHMNAAGRKRVLDQITQLANHCVRNRNHPSFDRVNCWIIFMVRKTYKDCWYSVYINSVLQKTKLNRIPGPPYELRVCAMAAGEPSEINCPFFRLEWKNFSEQFPTKFLIQYRSRDSDSETWDEKLTDESLKRPYQQDFPQRGSVMEFRIAAETCFGRSDFSKIVETPLLIVNEEMKQAKDCEVQQKLKNSSGFISENSASEVECVEFLPNVPPTKKQKSVILPLIDFEVANVPGKMSELKCTMAPLRFAENLAKQSDIIRKCNGMDFVAVPLTKSTIENKMKTFERFIFNPPGQQQVEETQIKTILLLGGTDPTCKMAFINAMINYVFNVQFEDNFRFQLLDEQAIGRTGIQVYEIRQAEGFSIPFSLTIIDVPNCEESKDLERDQKIIKMINSFLEVENGHGISELDLIGLVADASQQTLSSVEINFFNSIFSSFGKDLQENIRFLLTNADPVDVPPILTAVMAAGFPCLEDSTTEKPLHHKFNHSNFFGSNCEVPTQDSASNYWYKLHGRFCFKMGVKYFQEFFSALGLVKSKSLSMTKKVIQGSRQLESLKNDTQSLFMDGVNKKIEMIRNEMLMADCHIQTGVHSDTSFEDVARKVELSHGMLVNNCSKCFFTCSYDIGHIKIEIDDSMSQDLNHCHVCPGKCNWDVHSYSQSFKWEHAMEFVVSKTKKQKCDVEKEKRAVAQKVVETLKNDLEENGKAVLNQRDLIANCIIELETLSLRQIFP